MGEVMTELGFPVSVIEQMEEAGRWPDLTRLRERKPELLGVMVWMLGHSVPVTEICRACKVSPCTVERVRHSDFTREAVVSEKADNLAKMKLAFRLSLEHKIEEAQKGKLNMFDLKLLWEMIQMEEGGVTSRSEHVLTAGDAATMAFFDGLMMPRLAAGMVREAEILPAMGGAIEALAERSQDGLQLAASGLGPPASDAQPVDCERVVYDAPTTDSSLAAPSRGGGGRAALPPGPCALLPHSENISAMQPQPSAPETNHHQK